VLSTDHFPLFQVMNWWEISFSHQAWVTSQVLIHSVVIFYRTNQFLNYKHAILLYNVYNSHQPPQDWLSLNFNQILTRRQNNLEVIKTMNFKVGFNMISNRLSTLNKQIPLQWLNLSLNSYKVKCKTLFL
jgi:hypothetical protein